MLNASVDTVASAAITDQKLTAVIPTSATKYIKEIPCGDSIAPPLYAAELMTPVLNFRQASRCDIRGYEAGDERKNLRLRGHSFPHPHWMVFPRPWEYLKGLYILLGSIVTSLALLTFSGIARRWEH